MVSRLLASIEISRPHNMIAVGLCVAAGYRVAGGTDAGVAVVTMIVAALATGAGNIINDFFDIEIDRLNKPRRPLPSGRLSRRLAVSLYVVVSAVVLATAFVLLPLAVAVLVLVWQAALLAYARTMKRVFVVGNVLVAAITSSAFLAGGLLAGSPTDAAVPFAIGFFFVLSREIVKGAEDVRGDSVAGVGTLAVRLGIERTVAVASTMMLVLAVLIPLPALLGYYGWEYFWTMALLVVPGLIGGAWMILARGGKTTYNRVSWVLKAGMFFGILAIAMGRM